MKYRKPRTISFVLMVFGLFLSADIAAAGELRGRIVGASAATPAVVWIEGVGGDVPHRDTPITHVGGQFQPAVSVGFVGNSFVFGNSDETLHNTHLYMDTAYQREVSQRPLEYGTTLYNVALPHAGTEVRKPITSFHRYREETGFIRAICNRHPGETAFVFVFDHPYATITGEDGSFSIADVPAGKHELRIWQAGTIRKGTVVEVHDDAVTEIEVEKDSQ